MSPLYWLVLIGVAVAVIYIVFFIPGASASKELAEAYHEYKIEPDHDLSEIKLDMKKISDKLNMIEQLTITNANKIKALQLEQGVRGEQVGYLSGTTNALTQAFLDQP